jgi:OOP family OmpA-OmpF porin
VIEPRGRDGAGASPGTDHVAPIPPDPSVENLPRRASSGGGDRRSGGDRRQHHDLRQAIDAIPENGAGIDAEEAATANADADGKGRRGAAQSRTPAEVRGDSVRRNRNDLAAAIFPLIGPAVRKAMSDATAGMVDTVNSAIANSFSPRVLRWRIESWRTGVPFAQIVMTHTLAHQVEHVLLIHKETGLLLAHVPDEGGTDGDVISGMLTAIRDFVNDSFLPRATGEMRRFSVGDVNVLTETGPHAYLAAVVRGNPPEALREQLERATEEVHRRWSAELKAFSGDTAPFAEVRPLLAACLTSSSVPAAEPRSRGVARAVRIAAVALALIAVAALVTRTNRQWSRAVERLEQEPGIVLTSAERDGGRWRFAGFRDPLSADPASVLAAAGVDTSRVDATWESYESTQPPLVLARARRELAAPAGIALSLAGDTLFLRGAATSRWIARAVLRSPTIPGVSHLEIGAVTPLPSPDLSALRSAVETHAVTFVPESERLDSAGRAAVGRAAAAIETLQGAAASDGERIAVFLILGPEEDAPAAAHDLARRRLQEARAALIAAGISAGILHQSLPDAQAAVVSASGGTSPDRLAFVVQMPDAVAVPPVAGAIP